MSEVGSSSKGEITIDAKMLEVGNSSRYEIISDVKMLEVENSSKDEIKSTLDKLGKVISKMSEGDDIKIMIEDEFKLSGYDPSNHQIAKVPDFLRRGNTEAYDPAIVSIGPIHRDNHHCINMQEHKMWYLKQLLSRMDNKNFENYIMTVKGESQEKARKYYSSLIEIPAPDEFAAMLILDGVFVIELARKWSFPHMVHPDDYIFQFTKGDSKDEDNKDHCNEGLIQIRRDLLMIENQLPFFILTEIFEKTKMKDSGDNLYLLLLKFFRRIIPGRPDYDSNIDDLGADRDHLLGLVYEAYFVDKTIQHQNDNKFSFDEINSASELHEAGIKFKRFNRPEVGATSLINLALGWVLCGQCQRQLEVGATTLMKVKFEKGVMKIPKLEVGDVTESLFRNLIAYELIPFDNNGAGNKTRRKPRYVTEYCFLMQFLVNSKKDVEILRRAGIVTNWMGDDEMVRLFFNKLTKNVSSSQEFFYANIIREMNEYCKQWGNLKKWWTIFLRKYINSPWSILSVLAAVILLLITASNIVFTILSYKVKLQQHEKIHSP